MKWLLPNTNDLTWVPTTALICFLIAAGLLTYVVFRKNSKNNFEDAGMIPFREGEKNE